jgi:hypothetical protein
VIFILQKYRIMKTHSALILHYPICILLGIFLAKVIEEPSLHLRDDLSNRGADARLGSDAAKVDRAAAQVASSLGCLISPGSKGPQLVVLWIRKIGIDGQRGRQ